MAVGACWRVPGKNPARQCAKTYGGKCMMKKPIRTILLILTMLWLAFIFDTQLIVLRDDGMFTLHYDVPDEMKGKMFTGASWYSDSLMCRHFSFGSGRFRGTTYGTSFRNVEEKPGEWVFHIPTKIWHPFCTWERGSLTIGVHTNEEKTSYYELAYAYLFDEKKSDSKNPAKQEKLEDGQNESFLVCDVNEYDYKKIYPGRDYIEKSYSYDCKNHDLGGATHMSATPSVWFYIKDFGKLNISLSKNRIKYLRKNFFDTKKGRDVSYTKRIFFFDDKIYKITATLSTDKHWTIENFDAYSIISFGKPGLKHEDKNSTILTPDQLTYLASDDVWELPDFLQQ
jgi:hypothetical protein